MARENGDVCKKGATLPAKKVKRSPLSLSLPLTSSFFHHFDFSASRTLAAASRHAPSDAASAAQPAYKAFCTDKMFCSGEGVDGVTKYKSACSRNLTQSVEMAKYLKGLLASTDDPVLQAVYVRYFLSFGCQSNCNTLFTGNGYTAAGVGGLLAGEATEYLFSPFNGTALPEGKGVATVPFCLGVNGGVPDPNTGCTDLKTARP